MENKTSESAFFDQFANMMTGGMYGMVRWIWTIIFNVNTMLLMVFVRKNMGTKIAANGSWFFSSAWLFFLLLCSTFTAMPDDTTLSVHLIILHGIGYAVLSTWRRLGAWRSLRNAGRSGKRGRHTHEIGESVLFPLVHKMLNPLGLIDDEIYPETFWKMTQSRWMQYYEPVLFFLLGMMLANIGYGVYGKFIMFSSVCLFIVTFRTFNNNAKMRQGQEDAKIMGEISNPGSRQDHSEPHVIE